MSNTLVSFIAAIVVVVTIVTVVNCHFSWVPFFVG